MAQVKINDQLYDLPTELTIGESLDLARELGPASDTELGRAAGLVWIAVRRVHPKTTLEDISANPFELFEEESDRVPPTNGLATSTVKASEIAQTAQDPIGSRGSDTTME